ncbi:hypothetical protein EEB14_35255 [Rhodococcus sp. WS4]|nr:hypothetical protein EEB14_35255 [Rhodococcus sp. WS4]
MFLHLGWLMIAEQIRLERKLLRLRRTLRTRVAGVRRRIVMIPLNHQLAERQGGVASSKQVESGIVEAAKWCVAAVRAVFSPVEPLCSSPSFLRSRMLD